MGVIGYLLLHSFFTLETSVKPTLEHSAFYKLLNVPHLSKLRKKIRVLVESSGKL
jgi:hypothetical protein